jgi:ABC-type transporter MlaC component
MQPDLKTVMHCLFITMLVHLLSLNVVAGVPSPEKGMKELLNVVRQGKISKAGASSRLRHYFDYARLVDDPIGPHREKLSTEQMSRYQRVFRELLERAPFVARLGGDTKMEYRLGKPVKKGVDIRVALMAYNPKTDMDTELAFVWAKTSKMDWQVVDVDLDGASMMKGYQNQFGRILKKEGAQGLINRLEQRLSTMKKNQIKGQKS